LVSTLVDPSIAPAEEPAALRLERPLEAEVVHVEVAALLDVGDRQVQVVEVHHISVTEVSTLLR